MADPDQALACNPNRIMVSELLCYATEFMKSTTKEALGKTIYRFYDLEEITVAKTLLYDHFDMLGEFPQRKTSNNRSEKVAHTDDILNALMKLDETDTELTFAAVNIKRLPRWDPNEMDVVGMMEKINVLERRMSSLEVTVSESKADLIQTNDQLDILKVKVVHNENELKDIQPRLPTYAEKASVSCGSSVNAQPMASTTSVWSIGRNSGADNTGINGKNILPRPPIFQSFKASEPPQQKPPDSVASKETTRIQNRLLRVAGNDTDADTDVSEGYELSREDRRRRTRQRRQQNFIAGTAASTRLLGAPPPTRDFFVYRVDKSTSIEDIKDHLSGCDINIRDLKKVCHSESKFNSYKLSVSVTNADKVMDASIWPDGIRVRRFVRRFQQDRNDGSS